MSVFRRTNSHLHLLPCSTTRPARTAHRDATSNAARHDEGFCKSDQAGGLFVPIICQSSQARRIPRDPCHALHMPPPSSHNIPKRAAAARILSQLASSYTTLPEPPPPQPRKFPRTQYLLSTSTATCLPLSSLPPPFRPFPTALFQRSIPGHASHPTNKTPYSRHHARQFNRLMRMLTHRSPGRPGHIVYPP